MFLKNNNSQILTGATCLTFLRIACVPFIVNDIMMRHWYSALWLFILATATDILDGFVARMFNEQSVFGACLDPIADKILLLSSYWALARFEAGIIVPTWFIIPILIKEIVLLCGVFYLRITRKVPIQPTKLGKLAMLIQSCMVIIILISLSMGNVLAWLGYLLLFALLVIGAAFCEYVVVGLRFL